MLRKNGDSKNFGYELLPDRDSKFLDLRGQKYGRLTPLTCAQVRNKTNGRSELWWLCRCECMKEKVVKSMRLRNGAVQSCGCMRVENAALASKVSIGATTKWGKSERRNPIFILWRGINSRCQTNREETARYYKNRGIGVCVEWRENYWEFKLWAQQNGYSKGLQIDRINNDKGYSPDNCRFVTPKQQAANRRPSVPNGTCTKTQGLQKLWELIASKS